MSDPSGVTTLHVGGASPYDVVVGRDLLDRLPGVLGEAPERVALVHPERLGDLVHRVRTVLSDRDVLLIPVPDGEEAKTAAEAARCWEALGQAEFTRSDAVVTLGGGAASVWCTCRPACSRWSTPPWEARQASTPAPARTWSAPSTSRPASSVSWP